MPKPAESLSFRFDDPLLDKALEALCRLAPDGQMNGVQIGRKAIAAWTPDSDAVGLRKVPQPLMAPPPAPQPSPFVRGTRDWFGGMRGRDFDVASGEWTVTSRFPSADAAWETCVNGFGRVCAVAASLYSLRPGWPISIPAGVRDADRACRLRRLSRPGSQGLSTRLASAPL